MKKKDWTAETTLIKIMNNVKVVDGKTIACVMFHREPWKLVNENTSFDTAANRGNIIAEFKTREELWSYLKTI